MSEPAGGAVAVPRDEQPGLTPELEARIRERFDRYPERRAVLLPALHLFQETHGWISRRGMEEIADLLGLLPIEVLEVVTFYPMFHSRPVGDHHLVFCRNLSCALLGARGLVRHAEQRLGIRRGEVSPDGRFSIGEAECLGSCGTAPMVMVGGRYRESLDLDALDRLLEELGGS